jgi:hypothetical protein
LQFLGHLDNPENLEHLGFLEVLRILEHLVVQIPVDLGILVVL